MSDIDKTIAELKEIEAKATPEPVSYFYGPEDFCVVQVENSKVFAHFESQEDAELYVAMRNALPELIAGYERYRQEAVRLQFRMYDRTNERDAALVRAEKAEAERDALIKTLTPSEDTKAAYSGEVKMLTQDHDSMGFECTTERFVSWITIKDIMAMIRKQAAQGAAKREAGEA